VPICVRGPRNAFLSEYAAVLRKRRMKGGRDRAA
jgi:hypothetical protein